MRGIRQTPNLYYPGTASFLPYIGDVWPKRNDIWLGPLKSSAKSSVDRAPVVNYIADADRCGAALKMAVALVDQVGLPCFNPPRAVLATTRDQVATALADMPGLTAPRTIRLEALSVVQITEAVAAASLVFPVLVRVAGEHGGTTLIKIDDPDGFGSLAERGMLGRALYATEYRHFVDADGFWRKHRLAVVGGEVFLRHVIIGEGWLLHAASRAEGVMVEESARLASFDAILKPTIAPVVAEMARRLGLDYFGIDCHVAPDGHMTLFEANACMNILLNNQQPSPIWSSAIGRIREALIQLLRTPDRWGGIGRAQAV